MRSTTLLISSLAATTALLLAGCSSPGGSDDEAEDRVSINSLMGGPDYDNVDWQDQERQIQELVSVCMREAGWEYIPVEYPDFGGEWTDEDQLKQAQEQGFGIAYWTLNQGTENIDDPYADWVDPNQDYVESLSEAERTAYYESLYGTEEENMENTTTEIDPETGEEYQVQTGYGAGCQGEAYGEVYGEDPTQSPEYWEAVQVYYDELQVRVEADPRIIELNKAWSKCMKDAGYEFENQDALWEATYEEFQARHDEIAGDIYKDPMEGWSQEEIEEFWENTPQDEIDEFFNQPYDLTDEQRTQLEALLADEIELAVAQYECSKGHDKDMQDIYAEIEEQYALEHEDELRQLAASLADNA